MELTGQTLELTTPGRWGSAVRKDVLVRDSFQANAGRSYLLVENRDNQITYLLTSRYDGDAVDRLESGKMMMVVIGRQKDDVNIREFSRNSKTEEYFAYSGGGTIQILDAELENLRKSTNREGGLFGPVVGFIERLLRRKNN
ncbi:MAG: hypothetical protein AB9891_13835 [Anaerolineaceae bacterium]